MSDAPSLLWRVLSVAGFLSLVLAYLLNAAGRCKPTSRRYLWANTLGAGALAAYSARIDEPVFVGLEGFWCLASLFTLMRTRAPDA